MIEAVVNCTQIYFLAVALYGSLTNHLVVCVPAETSRAMHLREPSSTSISLGLESIQECAVVVM
jgi:hypothetical protein